MKISPYAKAIVAALWPVGEVFSAAWSDQTISPTELKEIGVAAAAALAVWATPARGYHAPVKGEARSMPDPT